MDADCNLEIRIWILDFENLDFEFWDLNLGVGSFESAGFGVWVEERWVLKGEWGWVGWGLVEGKLKSFKVSSSIYTE